WIETFSSVEHWFRIITAVLRNKAREQLSISPARKFSRPCSISVPAYTSANSGSLHDIFIREWMCDWLFVFGGVHVILLPALCNHFRLSLVQPCEETIPAVRPLSEFIFKFLVRFQHTKFASKHFKHASANWKEQANGFSQRELDRACSRKAPVHREC